MKTLKTTKLNALACWTNLRAVPPRDFNSVDEMEKTITVLETLKGGISEFVDLINESEQIGKDIRAGKIKDPAKAQQDFLVKSEKIESEKRSEVIEIEFEDEIFNTFFQLFDRWGKNWFNKIEEFLSCRRDINDTNSKPIK